MNKIIKTYCAGFLKRLLNISLITLCLYFISVPSSKAVDVGDLFTAEVFLDNETKNPLNKAYQEALNVVLQRISDSNLSLNQETVNELFPVPSQYVNKYRPSIDDKLWVSFDSEAIKKVLRNAGHVVWDSDRPLTLIWLAVDWGQGDREIISDLSTALKADQSRSIDQNRIIHRKISEIAEERAIPIVFPLLDSIDLSSITFSDIWGGFDEQVITASGRYKVDSILIGRIRPNSNQKNRWSYFFEDKNWIWTDEPNKVISEIADILAAEFAIVGNAPLDEITLNISGINTLSDFGILKNLLSNISLIEDLKLLNLSGNKVSYLAKVRGGAIRLSRALKFTGQLDRVVADTSSDLEVLNELEYLLTSN